MTGMCTQQNVGVGPPGSLGGPTPTSVCLEDGTMAPVGLKVLDLLRTYYSFPLSYFSLLCFFLIEIYLTYTFV